MDYHHVTPLLQGLTREFLNGPDITGFYEAPDEKTFKLLEELDPALRMAGDWEEAGEGRGGRREIDRERD